MTRPYIAISVQTDIVSLEPKAQKVKLATDRLKMQCRTKCQKWNVQNCGFFSRQIVSGIAIFSTSF